ncbi:DUF6879 family protein [Nocardia sp. NPDC127526]|uniref:DUF6879 family protein n=1 Tax=Nocardia sp. NPDC127526 TaxID=3345393 RepID=UPI00362735B1
MQYLQNDPAVWAELFRGCKEQAFHFEVRDVYGVPQESEPLRRFLSGEPPLVDDYKSDWLELVRETTGRGIAMGRIRVVTVPHSDYQRWLLSVTDSNVAAGEDIRYVPRHLAGEVPPDDWWMFDSERVVFNLAAENGASAPAMAASTDPRIIEYCQGVRQRLWELAVPYSEYVESDYARR